MKQLNYATAIGFIFMTLVAIHFKSKIEAGETHSPETTLDASLSHNSILKEDSLCQIWVNDTAQRIAFKHWYNKQLNKSK